MRYTNRNPFHILSKNYVPYSFLMTALRYKVLTGTFWSMFGQVAYVGVMLITNIIMSRILSPYEFGQVGIVMFFIVIANVLTESGLSGALVRKSDASETDFSTVFIFNLVVSVALCLLLILFAGTIAAFYKDPSLKRILMVLSTVLVINAFQMVQNAKLVKELSFKRKSVFNFVAIALASVIGIIAAWKGAGVWAMVLIQILSSLFLTILLWYYEGPVRKWIFSRASFKDLYAYGVNTTLASILNTAFDNIYQIIIGKYFSIMQVGLYYQAKKLQDVPGNVLNLTIQGALFSSLSQLQNDKEQFSRAYNKIILLFTVLMGLITSVTFLFSKEIIVFLFGAKWSDSTYFIQMLTLGSFFFLQETMNRNIFKVFNRTRTILHLELVKKAILCVSLVIGVFYRDLHIMLVGFVITSAISYLINFYYSRKILGSVSAYELIVVAKIIVIAAFNTLAWGLLFNYINLKGPLLLLLTPVFAVTYFVLLRVFRVSDIVKEGKQVLTIYKTKK
ncbi:lipopolysaccharide biosynthesis protein [Chitinophaga sp. RCC_12]|uniref:lipopolysaccharide biosynthesis protein n=1 Tax=Chitinophaga sp. RCC_12 TaxID=3239226 RepID=UPI003525409D